MVAGGGGGSGGGRGRARVQRQPRVGVAPVVREVHVRLELNHYDKLIKATVQGNPEGLEAKC